MQPSRYRAFALPTRMALREWRTSSVRLMAMALLISVAAVSAVGFFAGRVEHALLSDARSSLGADRLLISDRPVPSSWVEAAQRHGLQIGLGSSFPSVARAGKESLLVSVKSVGADYPQRGTVQIEGLSARGRPSLAQGEAWADPAVLSRLGLNLGDEIQLGQSRLRVTARLLLEPDRGMAFVNFSPRLMIRHEDLPATELVQPGSRISYRFWASSERPEALRAFDADIQPTLGAGQRFQSIDNARPELRATLDRAQTFLSLTGMVAVLTASAALWLSARQLARSLRPRVAVWKSLGASFPLIRQVVLRLLLSLVLFGGGLGLLLGFIVQQAVAELISGLLAVPLPTFPPSAWVTVAQGLGLTSGLLALLAWPVVVQALRVPALESLRGPASVERPSQERRSTIFRRAAQPLMLWLGLAAVMGLGSGQFELAIWVCAGFALMGLVVWLLLIALTKGLGLMLASRPRLPWILQGLKRALLRRSAGLSAQVLGLGLALSALFLLAFVRGDLIEAWGRSLPENAPNRFVLNVLPGEERSVQGLLQAAGVQAPLLAPMVRGRLVALNDQALSPEGFTDERAKRLLDREMNLTYANQIPSYNRLVRGRALDPSRAEVSVEEGIARTLGLRLGDRLEFDVAGDRVVAEVTSLRRVRWDSLSVNFFMVLSPALIEDQAKTWISSFYVSQGEGAALSNALLDRHPGLTIVELDAVLAQLRRVLTQVVTAIQALFGLSLVAGLLVLWAALVASRSERAQEAALLRAFGASGRQIAWAQALELSLVGLIAGGASASLAQVLGAVVAQQFFELPVSLNGWMLLLGAALGITLTVLSGLFALRPVLRQPAIAALRQSDPSGVMVSR